MNNNKTDILSYGLKSVDIESLVRIFGDFQEIESVIIFGSRAKGTARSGSDIDLAVTGEGVTPSTVVCLRAVLDDLPLPYFFDVIDFKSISNNELSDHIRRIGRRIYLRKGDCCSD